MKPNALVLALLTAATAMPVSARAADDLCSRIFIYAINQICQLLPNGQTLCQPIGLAGAGPNCESPSVGQQLVQIPLGPPAIQMSPFVPAANPYAPNPYAPNPLASAPYAPNPYAANPFAGNTYPPFPFAPNLFGPNPYAPNQNTPVAAQLQPRTPATTPPSLPVLPVPQQPGVQPATAQPPVPAAVVVAPVPSTIVAEPAATAPAEKPLVKLMPETPPTDTATVVAKATPSAPVAEAAPVTPEPVKPAATPQAAPAPVAAPIAATETLAVSETPKPAIVVVAPETAPTPSPESAASVATPVTTPVATPVAPPVAAPIPIAAPSAIMAAQPEDKEAAAKAETDRLQAEKALEDALAHFEFDSAELTPVGRAMLDAWLVQAPGDAPLVVTGHADRLGPEPYNEKLSLLRAEAVKKYLTEKGKPANRIQILAKGEHMPLINCSGGDATPETKACLAPNRRAEVAIKPASKVVKAKTVAKSATKNLSKNVKPAKSKLSR